MKSKIFFYNIGIARNLLRRFWPLWLAYLGVLLQAPLRLFGFLSRFNSARDLSPALNYNLGNMSDAVLYLMMISSIVVVMAVFSFLYHNRGCGLMNSLPVSRNTLFFTALITGLLPMLLADLLAAALTALLCRSGYLDFRTVLYMLGLAVFSKLFFYGFASFCAMLTGNLFVLPLVYALLIFAASVLDSCVQNVLCRLVYGMSSYSFRLVFLSPLVYLLHKTGVDYVEWPEHVAIHGLEYTAIYAVAGVIFALVSWLLFRIRRMETTGDTVAFRILKPIFRVCMSLGCAFVLTDVLYSLAGLSLYGRRAAVVILLFLMCCAFIGYFLAQMLLDKSFHVFRGQWKGIASVEAALLVMVGAAELDLLGYETYVPSAGRIERVSINDVALQEPDNIDLAIDFHRSLIAHKNRHEKRISDGAEYLVVTDDFEEVARNVSIIYTLNSGRTIHRFYSLKADQKEQTDPGSDIGLLETLSNCPEALESRYELSFPLCPENIVNASLAFNQINAEGHGIYEQNSVQLTEEQAVDFWENAVMADLAEGHIGRRTYLEADRGWSYTNAQLYLCLTPDREAYMRSGGNIYQQQWIDVQIASDSLHCLDWIESHTGIRPVATEYTYASQVYGVG